MSALLERLGLFARAPDTRSLAEIAGDIDAELAFHVEETARELVAGGLVPEEAHAEALRRFGDYGRIRRECARTQMGERIMMQRVQVVLTALLIVAVGVLLWSNHEARASMSAERAASMAMIARIEEQLASRSPQPELLDGLPAVRGPAQVPDDSGEYLDPSGKSVDRTAAVTSWISTFRQQSDNWRHGLKQADRLAALPGSQGVEILSRIYPTLSTAHREQIFKPFVFDGGHRDAVEVLALGLLDGTNSVRERAALYLETYAWKNLMYGGVADTWLAEWRDRPVAEVLRANATAWAREFGGVAAMYEQIPAGHPTRLLEIIDHVRPEVFATAGVDLAAILRENGIDRLTSEQLRLLSPSDRERVEIVQSWCRAK
ncbi:MAG: permease prefix domain 1-containing protein [Planctomycetota bacterium]|nr:permease prefix domain 1-containing protein [Planctomycetota bacterium]